jgi:hypothetical protein
MKKPKKKVIDLKGKTPEDMEENWRIYELSNEIFMTNSMAVPSQKGYQVKLHNEVKDGKLVEYNYSKARELAEKISNETGKKIEEAWEDEMLDEHRRAERLKWEPGDFDERSD